VPIKKNPAILIFFSPYFLTIAQEVLPYEIPRRPGVGIEIADLFGPKDGHGPHICVQRKVENLK